MCNDEFLNKDLDEACDIWSISWKSPIWENTAEKSNKIKPNAMSQGSINLLKEEDDVTAMIVSLGRKVEAMELNKVNFKKIIDKS